jgi:hypothetical protein
MNATRERMRIAIRVAPTAIPALAPVERPEDGDEVEERGVEEVDGVDAPPAR